MKTIFFVLFMLFLQAPGFSQGGAVIAVDTLATFRIRITKSDSAIDWYHYLIGSELYVKNTKHGYLVQETPMRYLYIRPEHCEIIN